MFFGLLILPVAASANPQSRPDVEVNVPAEVFSSGGQRSAPCNQCC
ncbi:DUF1496 domain-containing protein, partial [Escherichia coli]|nr:DUF1496 domain-containing protein [Escherichia coli]